MVGCSSQEGSSVCRQLRHAVMMTLEGQTTWCAAPALQLREQRALMLLKHATSVNLLSARPSLASIAPPRGLHGEQHIASALWLQLHSARTMHAVCPATSAILTPVLHGLWHSQATPAARAQPRCGTFVQMW